MEIRRGQVVVWTSWLAILTFAAVANNWSVTAATQRPRPADRPKVPAFLQQTEPGTPVSAEAIIERVQQVDVMTLDAELPSAGLEV